MRSGLRAGRALGFALLGGLAVWCLLGSFDSTPREHAAADDAPRSTLKIGVPRTTNTAQSSQARTSTPQPTGPATVVGNGAARFVIRTPAPIQAPVQPPSGQVIAPPAATPAQPMATQPVVTQPSAPQASAAQPIAQPAAAAAPPPREEIVLPPIVGFTPSVINAPGTSAGPALAAPPVTATAPVLAAPAAQKTSAAATPSASAPVEGGVTIAGDGALNDGLPTAAQPATASPTGIGIAIATDEPSAAMPARALAADPSVSTTTKPAADAAVSARTVAAPPAEKIELPPIQSFNTPTASADVPPAAAAAPTTRTMTTSAAPPAPATSPLGVPGPGVSAREAFAETAPPSATPATTSPALASETPATETLEADTAGSLTSAATPEPAVIDPTTIPPHKLEPVDFNGVLLGETTLDEVVAAWGKPLARSGNQTDARLKYQIEPFAGVEVAFVGGKATAVVVDLGDLFAPPDIARELTLDMAEAVPVEDPTGKTLGLLFPERGVALRFEDDTPEPRVARIGLDVIKPAPFIMRAEYRRVRRPAAALADLATAIALDAGQSRAHWVKSRILADAGRPREALAAVEEAIRLDPKAAEFLLTRAALLADQGLFDAALKDNETVLNGTQKLLHYQARGWRQRGDLLADGPERNVEEAVDAHTRAVRVAEKLLDEPRVVVRRDAEQTLVEAHLAIAEDIAWGEYAERDASARQWLTKAETLAKQFIAEDGLNPHLMLDVYTTGLAACVGTPGAVDAKLWAEQLQTAAQAALADCDDPLLRRQLQFEAGLGLYDALQALHAQGDIDSAIKFGTAAVDLIQSGRQGRDESPTDAYRFGRLYFRIGSLYAVAKKDHKQAVAWFDRAAPLLERPLPEAAAADRGRQGETLVSMGISYWAQGNRDRGLYLTELGSKFMQEAVKIGALDPAAMGVAYSNLSVMHGKLGDETKSRDFYEMAARAEPAKANNGTMRR